MNYNYYKKFVMTEKKEEKLWETCEFIFDTSSLLALYYYSQEAQKDIFEKTLNILKGRLWIPGHAGYEYFKNRRKVINNLIEEKYNYIDDKYLNPLENNIEKIEKTINGLSEFTKKNEKRPHIDSNIIKRFKKENDEYQETFKLFKEDLNKKLNEEIENVELLLDKDNDQVLDQITEYFQFGKEYPTNKVFDIIKEGKIRYSNNWPPGYEDEKNKDGMQIYGDLIIWKQVIEYAKEQRKPIVLITNDVTKNDWCYQNKRGRIKSPREELIKELNDEAGVNFWMYNLSQFLFKADNLLDTDLSDKTLEEVENISNTITIKINNKPNNIFKIKNQRPFYYNSIINLLKKNLDIKDIEYPYEKNKYIDFVFYSKNETEIGVIIEKIKSGDINRLGNTIDWLYDNTRTNNLRNIYLFLVTDDPNLDININKEELQHFINRNFHIFTGYIDKNENFILNNKYTN